MTDGESSADSGQLTCELEEVSDDARRIENLEHLGKYITLADRAQNSLIAEKLSDYDITRGQLPILLCLYQEDGVSQQKFANLYDLDKSVVTRTIDKLSDKGFVYREESPEDRRKNLVKLTEKAKEFKPHLLDILEEKERGMNQGLTQEEKELFKKLIKKMISNLRDELDREIK